MTVTRLLQIEVPFNTKLTFFIHPIFVFHSPSQPPSSLLSINEYSFKFPVTEKVFFISFPPIHLSFSLQSLIFLKFLFKFSKPQFSLSKIFPLFATTPRAKKFYFFFSFFFFGERLSYSCVFVSI